jgi:hypothetical protein
MFIVGFLGTRSTLLAKRSRDTSRTGFRDWAFMTTHNWGETAYGTWTLEIDNDGWDGKSLLLIKKPYFFGEKFSKITYKGYFHVENRLHAFSHENIPYR